MEKCRKNTALSNIDNAIEELYSVNTYVSITKRFCQEQEFKGEYYGLNYNYLKKLSEERNSYITMLSLIAEKIADIIKINLNLEEELTLQKNSNNSRR